MYDKDNSGHLSSFELRQALASAGNHYKYTTSKIYFTKKNFLKGYNVNNKVLESLALRYGNEKGQVMFDDFIMCAVKIKCMIGMGHFIYKKFITKK